MLTRTRQEEIVKLVNEKNGVTVTELKELFHASESTIRRDITTLDEQGLISKVFGGAVSLLEKVSIIEPSMEEKKDVNVAAKIKIAAHAAMLIEPQDLVYIDAGTTTSHFIDYIKEANATYVTNAISHVRKLAEKGFVAILIGGTLKQRTDAIVGAEAILNLQKYHFTKAFFGSNGVHLKHGCTTPDPNEAAMKHTAVQNTVRNGKYVLVDESKFGTCSGVTFGQIDEFVFITDNVTEEYKKRCNIEIVEKD